jgi:hypothetical protein
VPHAVVRLVSRATGRRQPDGHVIGGSDTLFWLSLDTRAAWGLPGFGVVALPGPGMLGELATAARYRLAANEPERWYLLKRAGRLRNRDG